MLKSIFTAIAFAAVAVPALSQESVATVGELTLIHPWARAAASGTETLVFMEIENAGSTDRLMGGETPVAEAVHVVGLSLSGADISVEEVGPVEIAPGEFVLDPGGLALELHGLRKDLVEGERFTLIVQFERAGPVTLDVEIAAADATADGHHH